MGYALEVFEGGHIPLSLVDFSPAPPGIDTHRENPGQGRLNQWDSG